MAENRNRAGRPCLVADIDQRQDRELALRYEFHNICSSLSYSEMMALSRTLAVHYGTVLHWKYNTQFPRRDIALQIIDWAKAGKPMHQVRPYPEVFDTI